MRKKNAVATRRMVWAPGEITVSSRGGGAVKQHSVTWDDLAAGVVELSGPPNRYRHGWIKLDGSGAAAPKPLRAPGRADPRSVTAVGGGRKNWVNEASQPPDARARKDFPAVAARMRQITPGRLQQARDDETRIAAGLAPLHPELAQVWPDIYGKAKGVTAPLPLPKAPRPRKDPRSVTGLTDPRADYLKAAYLQSTGNLSGDSPAVELAFRFRHGWNPVGPSAADHDKVAAAHLKAADKAADPAVRARHGRLAAAHRKMSMSSEGQAVAELAYGWDDLTAVIAELSAETGRLAASPAPRGKPGGPGLYGVKGNMHSPYMQNIVKALIEKRGMDPGKAYAIAWGAMRKWSRGGGKVHPEVAAAAAGSLGLEKAAEARAHAHSVSWADLAAVIELAAAPAPAPASSSSTGKVQPRVPAGQAGGGRFGSGGGQPDAHQQHLAHLAHLKNTAARQGQQKSAASATAGKTASATAKAKIAAGQQSKAGLLKQAAGFRAKADALIAQRKALQAQLASASGATSSGQSGSTTSSGASTTSSGASTTASTAPAAGTTAAAATPATAAAATTTPSAGTTALTTAQRAQVTAQVAQLGTQIVALQKQYAQAMAAAAKL